MRVRLRPRPPVTTEKGCLLVWGCYAVRREAKLLGDIVRKRQAGRGATRTKAELTDELTQISVTIVETPRCSSLCIFQLYKLIRFSFFKA